MSLSQCVEQLGRCDCLTIRSLCLFERSAEVPVIWHRSMNSVDLKTIKRELLLASFAYKGHLIVNLIVQQHGFWGKALPDLKCCVQNNGDRGKGLGTESGVEVAAAWNHTVRLPSLVAQRRGD